jgi:hypothetical protein
VVLMLTVWRADFHLCYLPRPGWGGGVVASRDGARVRLHTTRGEVRTPWWLAANYRKAPCLRRMLNLFISSKSSQKENKKNI